MCLFIIVQSLALFLTSPIHSFITSNDLQYTTDPNSIFNATQIIFMIIFVTISCFACNQIENSMVYCINSVSVYSTYYWNNFFSTSRFYIVHRRPSHNYRHSIINYCNSVAFFVSRMVCH